MEFNLTFYDLEVGKKYLRETNNYYEGQEWIVTECGSFSQAIGNGSHIALKQSDRFREILKPKKISTGSFVYFIKTLGGMTEYFSDNKVSINAICNTDPSVTAVKITAEYTYEEEV